MKTFSRLLFFIVLLVLVASFIGCDGLISPPSDSDTTLEENNESSDDSDNENSYEPNDSELLRIYVATQYAYNLVQNEISEELYSETEDSPPTNMSGEIEGDGYLCYYEISLEDTVYLLTNLTINYSDYTFTLGDDLFSLISNIYEETGIDISGSYIIDGTFTFSTEEVDPYLMKFQGTVDSTDFTNILEVELTGTGSGAVGASFIINETNYFERIAELLGLNPYVPTEEEVMAAFFVTESTFQSLVSTLPTEINQEIINSEETFISGTYYGDSHSIDYWFNLALDESNEPDILDGNLNYDFNDYPVEIETSTLAHYLPDYDYSVFGETVTFYFTGEMGCDNSHFFYEITIESELFGGDIDIDFDANYPVEVYVNGIDYSDWYEELTTVD